MTVVIWRKKYIYYIHLIHIWYYILHILQVLLLSNLTAPTLVRFIDMVVGLYDHCPKVRSVDLWWINQTTNQPTKGGIVKEVLFLFLCSLVLSLDLLLDSGQVIAIKARCCWLGGYGLALMGWCYFSNGWEMVITKQSAYTRSAQVSYLFSKRCIKYINYTFYVKSQHS